MSERAKVRFIVSIETEVDGSEELQRAVEYSAAGFLEALEHSLDQHIQTLRAKYPECNFSVGTGNDGEEWKNE